MTIHRLCARVALAALVCLGTPAVAAPEDDLGVSFGDDPSRPWPGGIAGKVTNRSARTYPCVDLVFFLLPDAGGRRAEQRVRLRNVTPRSVKPFSSALKRPAGFGLQEIRVCAAEPIPPVQARTCTVTGKIASNSGFSGIDDTGQRLRIDRVYVQGAGDREPVADTALSRRTSRVVDHRNNRRFDTRDYRIGRLPSGRAYVAALGPAWRTRPAEVAFACPDRRGRFEFSLPTLDHVGNRLGG